MVKNMETLAYLHLALANQAPIEADWVVTWNWQLPRCGMPLLSLMLVLSTVGTATQTMALVQPGDRGSEVVAIQQRLQDLGYFRARVTGNFGPITKEAVIRFQQKQGLAPDGIAGAQTLASLQCTPKATASLPPSSTQRQQPARAVGSRPVTNVLRRGDRGTQVSAVQESLAVAGVFKGPINGIFGPLTEAAVKQFQQARRLPVDGVIGSQTRTALPAIGGTIPTSTSKSSDGQQLCPERDRASVLSLQQRLQAQGFYRGALDGIWGSQTQTAVEAAQQAYGVK
jgi:peptidoglycan hydrolase-like protein with peptidoglycan-binding domain